MSFVRGVRAENKEECRDRVVAAVIQLMQSEVAKFEGLLFPSSHELRIFFFYTVTASQGKGGFSVVQVFSHEAATGSGGRLANTVPKGFARLT